jgi:AbrB family transcriptional regulator (stage V sporulation protein T)
MSATISIDKAGRIVLPKAIRDELHLSPGGTLEVEVAEDRIVLRPARVKPRLYKKYGIWVFHTGVPMDVDLVEKTRKKIRDERETRFLGKRR